MSHHRFDLMLFFAVNASDPYTLPSTIFNIIHVKIKYNIGNNFFCTSALKSLNLKLKHQLWAT